MTIFGISPFLSAGGQSAQPKKSATGVPSFEHVLFSLHKRAELPMDSERPNRSNEPTWSEIVVAFLKNVPASEAYADPQTLENETVQALLNAVPEQLQTRVIESFSERRPLEKIVEENGDELMFALVSLLQLEQKQIPIPAHVTTYVQQQLGVIEEEKETPVSPQLPATMRLVAQEGKENREIFNGLEHVAEVSKQGEEKVATNELGVQPTVKREESKASFARSPLLPLLVRENGHRARENEEKQAPSIQSLVRTLIEENETAGDVLASKLINGQRQQVEKQTSEWLAAHKETIKEEKPEKLVLPFTSSPLLNARDEQMRPNALSSVMTVNAEDQEAFVHQLERVMRVSKLTQMKNGQAQLVVRLHPEHLGFLTIKLTQQKEGLAVKVITSTKAAKELVDAHIQQLASAIPAEHITVEQFDVFEEAKFRDSASHQQKQQHEQGEQREQKREEREKQSFQQWLEEWFNSVV